MNELSPSLVSTPWTGFWKELTTLQAMNIMFRVFQGHHRGSGGSCSYTLQITFTKHSTLQRHLALTKFIMVNKKIGYTQGRNREQ